MSSPDRPNDQDQIDVLGTKPMFFPPKKNTLIRSTSSLRRVDGGKWVLANMIAPPEIIARAEEIILQNRKKIEMIMQGVKIDVQAGGLLPDQIPEPARTYIQEIQQYEQIITSLGGNVRSAIMDVYGDFDFWNGNIVFMDKS